MTTPTRAEICADLACAMGWKVIKTNSGFMPISPEGHAQLNYKTEDFAWATMPDPFTNAADNRALVEWLAQDNARWTAFYRILEDALKIPEGEMRAWRAMWLLTAPLETIAEAAWPAP